ncbi:MAG: type II toxin-antitoxin system VapC family toxin [Proteobacteria bacterium]|nr:type II toxin-antitoxin system VapC family toxin [Pseudomonadota bacterium]MBS0461974.1 type II toxin-antitoxin system VapC family toxin [Pseudomonadota bacterium]
MILVDTNILLDVLENDPAWADWSLRQLRAQSQAHDLAINPVIYAELSLAFDSVQALDAAIQGMGLIEQELPRPALFLAGRAFLKYRREGGSKANVLPDFFIGAHAAVQGWDVLTRDARRYRSYFPTVALITPEAMRP